MTIARARSRRRDHINQYVGVHYVSDSHGGWVFASNQYQDLRGIPKLLEECRDETHTGPPYRVGGPLFLRRLSVPLHVIEEGTYYDKYNARKYDGCFIVIPLNLKSYYDQLSAGDAWGWGAKGWNMYRPVKPMENMGQFIYELRDIGQMFAGLKERLLNLIGAGKHYLNYQFGWKPFLNDLHSALFNGDKMYRRIAWIRKNNGKWVKRGGTVTASKDRTNMSSINMIYPVLTTAFYPSSGISLASRWITTERRVWFEARMKYFIPGLEDDKAENFFTSPLLRRLWGLELTPSLIWELLPWSWLCDWFFDVGDVYANLSNTWYENLTAKYAFIMETKEQIYHIDQTQTLWNGRQITASDVQFHVIMKERAEASPFGFGNLPDWTNLSVKQLAILAALGLTRGH